MSTLLLPDVPVASLEEYVATRDGGGGLEAARSLGTTRMVDEVDRSGLRGRGGAGFPAGRKWASVAAEPVEAGPRYVVANGAEGEPGTFKDRLLMARNPYQVLEGLQIAAETLGADAAFLALKASFRPQIDALERAAAEMVEVGMLGSIPLTIVPGPDEYLFGEEKALLEVIEGEDPLPRLFPPYIYGLFTKRPQMGWSAGEELDRSSTPTEPAQNPTLVSNVETLANVPVIARLGAQGYRERGTDGSPGVALFTVMGDTRRAGVAELELGTPLAEILDAVGGGMARGDLKLVLPGVANPVVPAARVDTPASYEAMEAAGSGLGACGFIVYDDTRDAVSVARMVSRFLYVESCGQCRACKYGTGQVTAHLDDIATGDGDERSVELIGARLRSVTDANRCYLGEQEQRVIGSLLREFPDDFAARLAAGRAAVLPVPKIVDIVDGEARLDEAQTRKRPDWTYAPHPLDRVAQRLA